MSSARIVDYENRLLAGGITEDTIRVGRSPDIEVARSDTEISTARRKHQGIADYENRLLAVAIT